MELFHKCHLINEIAGSSNLLDGEEDIAYVKRDVAAYLWVKYDIAHGSFPYTVEVQSDKVAVCIDYRAS